MQKTTGKKTLFVHAHVNFNILGYFASITSLAERHITNLSDYHITPYLFEPVDFNYNTYL